MIKRLYIVLVLSTTFTFFGQNARFEVGDEPGFLYFSREGGVPSKKEASINGSQYIDSKFERSKVYGYEGSTPLMRYNAFRDEIEFIDNNKTYYLIKTDSTKVNLSNKIYSYNNYNDENGKQNGYLIEILKQTNTKFSLYKKEKIILVPEFIPNSSYQNNKPAHYKIEDKGYYLGINNRIVNMPSKKKEFISLLSNNQESVEKFIKENKISFKSEEDIIKLINYMNTL